MDETEAYRMLASADRQLLLHKLVHDDREVTEEDLSRHVAAGRHQIPFQSVSEEELDRAHLRLVHNHFPMLYDLDIIEQSDGMVALADDQHHPGYPRPAESRFPHSSTNHYLCGFARFLLGNCE